MVKNPDHGWSNVTLSVSLGIEYASPARCLVVYGDLVFTPDCLSGLAALPPDQSAVVVDPSGYLNPKDVGVNISRGLATNFSFGLHTKWAQIALLAGDELELFRDITRDPVSSRHYLWETFNAVVERGGEFTSVSPGWYKMVEVDSPRDYKLAQDVGGGR